MQISAVRLKELSWWRLLRNLDIHISLCRLFLWAKSCISSLTLFFSCLVSIRFLYQSTELPNLFCMMSLHPSSIQWQHTWTEQMDALTKDYSNIFADFCRNVGQYICLYVWFYEPHIRHLMLVMLHAAMLDFENRVDEVLLTFSNHLSTEPKHPFINNTYYVLILN